MSRVIWRNVVLDERTYDQAKELDRLTGDIPIRPSQGSYSTGVAASASTHAGGGALDLSLRGISDDDAIEIVRQGRRIGLWGWIREEIPGTWPRHLHMVSVGCRDLAPAAARQIEEARAGGDGLKGNAPDPHAFLKIPVRTWEEYLEATWPIPSDHVLGRRTWRVRVAPWGRRVHDGSESATQARFVRRWQDYLGVPKTGRFDAATEAATKGVQRRLKVRETGNLSRDLARTRGLLR